MAVTNRERGLVEMCKSCLNIPWLRQKKIKNVFFLNVGYFQTNAYVKLCESQMVIGPFFWTWSPNLHRIWDLISPLHKWDVYGREGGRDIEDCQYCRNVNHDCIQHEHSWNIVKRLAHFESFLLVSNRSAEHTRAPRLRELINHQVRNHVSACIDSQASVRGNFVCNQG